MRDAVDALLGEEDLEVDEQLLLDVMKYEILQEVDVVSTFNDALTNSKQTPREINVTASCPIFWKLLEKNQHKIDPTRINLKVELTKMNLVMVYKLQQIRTRMMFPKPFQLLKLEPNLKPISKF